RPSSSGDACERSDGRPNGDDVSPTRGRRRPESGGRHAGSETVTNSDDHQIATIELLGPAGEPVDFRRLLASHGVVTLAPNRVSGDWSTLETTVALDGGALTLSVSQPAPGLALIATPAGRGVPCEAGRVISLVRHLLRLDEDLSPFYARAARDPGLAWATAGAGRMVRSAMVFEDVVKTVCTTNCSWGATVRMTDAIVGGLGPAAADGRHAFPAPAAMAQAGEDFYRDVARCGYRGAYLRRLAAEVAEGRLDLEALLDPELSDAEVEQRLLALPGVGPYAAAHVMLTSVGRYRRLILDSWTRPTYAKLTGRAGDDAAIVRRFRRYGAYAGLAFWLLLTRDWVVD
ncbi:MAG: DNA-3-methyladenine glycosylase family protein, partial [Solirubrobacteraceae bacterium]